MSEAREVPGESLVERVLRSRGVLGADGEAGAMERFLSPRLSELHDPSLMPELDRAAERLLEALHGGEGIVIYGDYDADGITAAAILFHMLGHLASRSGLALAGGAGSGVGAANVRTYVPHRLEEGYGLKEEAVAALARDGAKVIVSVDCGIGSHGPARRARECGVDLIITDHHNPPSSMSELPEAFAVVHPRRADSAYPFGELCGAGVAYKLAWRLATMSAEASVVSDTAGGRLVAAPSGKVDAQTRELLVDLLAYAALGTVADVVPLVGENRVIARYGLSRLRHVGTSGAHARRFGGVQALIDAAGLDGEAVSATDVGFKLAPRLNAAGRLGHAGSAVELLTVADDARAKELAAMLSRQNDERRAVEREIFEQACERAEAAGMIAPGRHAIVLADERWHPGVVGIVCSRMVERFGRPTILMCSASGTCQGSGRSIDGFSLHAALERFAGMLERFGGHDMAAGLSIRSERLEGFTSAFVEYASGAIAGERLTPRLRVDCDAEVREFTHEALRALERVGPFGRGNSPVRVRVRGVRLATGPRMLGSHGKHVSLLVKRSASKQEETGPGAGEIGGVMRVVGWNWGAYAERFREGAMLDMVVEPRLSTWNGQTRVEAELCDAAER